MTELFEATFAFTLDAEADARAIVRRFAVGQTTGTWVEVPGLTDELRAAHEGRVLSLYQVPAADTTTSMTPGRVGYLVTIGIPSANVGDSLPQLLNTVIGNDASTSMEAKLVGLRFPDAMLDGFGGPGHGIEGLRRLTGVADRPLLLNMLKPCVGLSPSAAAEIFEATARGGIDLIKDDELMGNTGYSTVLARVEAFRAAADRAEAETGRHTVYLPNVTDRPDRMLKTAKAAVDAGAEALMVAYTTVGYGGVQMLRDEVGVPVLGHFAGAAPFFEGAGSGMASELACGLLPRLAGADLALVNTPFGGYPITKHAYLQTAARLVEPLGSVKAAMPIIGGGVHPGTVARYVGDLGNDIVLGAGGAIQGHPMGAAAGVRAMLQAIEAVREGVPLDQAEGRELQAAVARWGVLD
ncbi:RuBisCO large subunit C-terminal-like domain-containing protein [Propionibacteriaceae bacterium G57]|uniref:RuBisCO large subunit C-terminal-like domain-containing protein n=1 Tax=Aestuariimicrobium sp. G57 TaxID=3418485 RepID=UPI003DA719D0